MLSCWNIWTDRSFVTTVRPHLTRFDIEGQTNTKGLSYSLNATLSFCQGTVCVSERPGEMNGVYVIPLLHRLILGNNVECIVFCALYPVIKQLAVRTN